MMKSLYYFSVLAIALALAVLPAAKTTHAVAGADNPDSRDVVTGMRDRYGHIRDLRADFVHRAPIALTGSIVEEKGVFFYSKPAHLRWEYTDPPGKMMLITPEDLFLYLPDDRLLYRQKTDRALASQPVVRFMTGLEDLDRDFDIAFADPARDSQGNYRLELKPRESDAGFQSLILFIHKDTFIISGYVLTDPYGATSTFFFDNISFNSGLPASVFHFEPPPDVRIETLH